MFELFFIKKSRIAPTILKEMGNVTTLSMICPAPLLLTRSDPSIMHLCDAPYLYRALRQLPDV